MLDHRIQLELETPREAFLGRSWENCTSGHKQFIMYINNFKLELKIEKVLRKYSDWKID